MTVRALEEPALFTPDSAIVEQDMRALLLGPGCDEVDLPPVNDLAIALQTLQRGHRAKVLMPLSTQAVEYALVLDGDTVLVSCYGTASTPEVHVLHRAVPVGRLAQSCHDYAQSRAHVRPDCPVEQETVRVTENAVRTRTVSEERALSKVAPVVRRGGALDAPNARVPLAFGYSVRLRPQSLAIMGNSERADVHAMLFDGDLWAWARGQRVTVATGPIMLAAQRMLAAVASIADAVSLTRNANVRLKSGGFQVAFRVDADQSVSLTLGCKETVTLSGLTVQQATLPILRLASDLCRMMIAVDKSQTRNLRVRALRAEVRALRRRIRGELPSGFLNEDPDRFRMSLHEGNQPESGRHGWRMPSGIRGLRFSEQWRQDLPDLDSASTYLCGDSLVVSSPEQSLALCRTEGKLLWLREGCGGPSMIAGRVLVRNFGGGHLELCDLRTGAGIATATLGSHVRSVGRVTYAGGRDIPPVILVTDAAGKLLAVDARNGELRWRFTAEHNGGLQLSRMGRLLIVSGAGSAVHAIDLSTGEEVWRFMAHTPVTLAAGVTADTVSVAESGGSTGEGMLHGVDLLSGKKLWEREMDAVPTCAPTKLGDSIVVGWGSRDQSSMARVHARTGELRWAAPDPGISAGGASLIVDDVIIVNAPGGKVCAVDANDGSIRWWTSLADPVADEVPRNLEPVLRGGALFVPAASVHVLRPSDGKPLGVLAPDTVPDFLRVDERGWAYVGEEHGGISAHAAQPHLQLIKS